MFDKRDVFVIFGIAFLIVIMYLITGCSTASSIAENIAEEDFTQGCKAVHATTNLGYFSQTGTASVPCKVKCSKELPADYCFKFNSKTPYGNCNVKAGSGCDKEIEQ